MSFGIDIATDVKAAGGTLLGGLPAWAAASHYGVALDGSGLMEIGIPAGLDQAALVQIRRVFRLTSGSTSADTGALTQALEGEYRIRKISRDLGGILKAQATPILLDLGDIFVSTVTAGGSLSYRIEASDLTPAEWIDTYILPVLVRAGISWIVRGTITPTTRRTLSFERWTILQLLRELTDRSDYDATLDNNADTNYQINITAVGAGAPVTQLVVGRNVQALSWDYDGIAQATVVAPRGITPAGESEGRGPGEFAVRVSAVGAGDVTLADPDGNLAPIYFDDQENGHYLELLLPHILLQDLSGTAIGGTGTDSRQTEDRLDPFAAAYASSTLELAVTIVQQEGTTGRVVFYTAATRVYAGMVTVGTTPRGIYYHTGQDRLYVCNFGSGTVSVVNPNTRAVTATITVQTGPTGIAFATSSGKLFVTNATTGSVSVIDPSTNTVTATIAGLTNPTEICYDSTNDRIVVACAAGDLKFINPGTNTVVNTLNLGASQVDSVCFLSTNSRIYAVRAGVIHKVDGSGAPSSVQTISTFTSPTWVMPEPSAGRVWVVHGTAGSTKYIGQILPGSPDTVGTTANYLALVGASGVKRPGPIVNSVAFFPIAPGTITGWLAGLDITTVSLALRRQVTDTIMATGKVTLAAVAPIAVEDVVSFRDDAAGTLREELVHPIKSQAPPTGYGRIARILASDQLRGERNYAVNPWGAIAGINGYSMPGWSRTRGLNQGLELVARDYDASAWTTFACQVDGIHAASALTVNLKGLTPGDVINPGDYLTTVARMAGSRGVVDGAGKVSIKVGAGLTSGLADGLAFTIDRSALKGASFPTGNRVPVLPIEAISGNHELGCWIPAPLIVGRGTLWITMDVDVWPISLQPSTQLALRIYEQDTVIATTFHADAATYTDKIVRNFTISYAYTVVEGAKMVGAFVRAAGTPTAAIYVRGIQAVLGLEGNLYPRFRVNASAGELYHAAQRALRDLADPPITYEVTALEDDRTIAGVALGSRPILEHANAGLVATPRAVAIDYPIPPPSLGGTVTRQPIVQLDNRPPSLSRLLAAAGIS